MTNTETESSGIQVFLFGSLHFRLHLRGAFADSGAWLCDRPAWRRLLMALPQNHSSTGAADSFAHRIRRYKRFVHGVLRLESSIAERPAARRLHFCVHAADYRLAMLTATASLTPLDPLMHSIELARMAALIAAQGPALISSRSSVSAEATVQYWSASRQRFELWNRGLGRLSELLKAGRSVAARDWWQEHLAMLEEILISETLTRVMAALGAALDGDHAHGEVEPITQTVFMTHLESRNRVLRLLLFGRGGSVDQSLRLNRLRRCVERWTDRLLSPLVTQHTAVLRFAHDRGRARGYGGEAADALNACEGAVSNQLTLAALQTSLTALSGPRAALPQANRQIGQAVLACLPPELFDSHGLLCSAATRRLRRNHSPECQPRRSHPAQHLLLKSLPAPVPASHLVRWTL